MNKEIIYSNNLYVAIDENGKPSSPRVYESNTLDILNIENSIEKYSHKLSDAKEINEIAKSYKEKNLKWIFSKYVAIPYISCGLASMLFMDYQTIVEQIMYILAMGSAMQVAAIPLGLCGVADAKRRNEANKIDLETSEKDIKECSAKLSILKEEKEDLKRNNQQTFYAYENYSVIDVATKQVVDNKKLVLKR